MSETPVPLPTMCHGCGQTDPDPKIQTSYNQWQKDPKTIVVDPDFHYDCLPQDLREQLIGPANAVTAAAVEAADSGVRGEALREFIQAQPNDNNLDDTQED